MTDIGNFKNISQGLTAVILGGAGGLKYNFSSRFLDAKFIAEHSRGHCD